MNSSNLPFTAFSYEAAIVGAGPAVLLAGKGGLNLTHSEPFDVFIARFSHRSSDLVAILQQFGPEQVRAWAQGLGVDTFIGTSGRVFPVDMKAAPLLRAWLHRLRGLGVKFHMRHHWTGWSDSGQLQFSAPTGTTLVAAKATVLALGGASWARLGSDGAWVPWLVAKNITVAPLRPSNCRY